MTTMSEIILSQSQVGPHVMTMTDILFVAGILAIVVLLQLYPIHVKFKQWPLVQKHDKQI
jgi:hypothetical protein